jgi:hypothetical protein
VLDQTVHPQSSTGLMNTAAPVVGDGGNFLNSPINPILFLLAALSHPSHQPHTCETFPHCSKTAVVKLHKTKTPVFISLTLYLIDTVHSVPRFSAQQY